MVIYGQWNRQSNNENNVSYFRSFRRTVPLSYIPSFKIWIHFTSSYMLCESYSYIQQSVILCDQWTFKLPIQLVMTKGAYDECYEESSLWELMQTKIICKKIALKKTTVQDMLQHRGLSDGILLIPKCTKTTFVKVNKLVL